MRARAQAARGDRRPTRPAVAARALRLVVPEGEAKQAEILGHGADAAAAVVELLEQIGVAS